MKTSSFFYKVGLIQAMNRTLEQKLQVREIISYPFPIFISDIEIQFMMVPFYFPNLVI